MKKENARRSKMLHFAVTEEEARIIDEKMKQLEIRNMSAFLRAMVLNGYVLKLDLPQLREMIRLLGNLNRERAAGIHKLHEPAEQFFVVRYPLEAGV